MLERMDFGSMELPAALRTMGVPALRRVADEVRRTIIDVVSRNGGHMGASLGAVELIVALHAVFESPSDRFVFDVGHQAYAHKLLTVRWKAFDTLRKRGGISGFTLRSESEHDPFGAGHAGTALSAAVGIRYGMDRAGRRDSWVVAVVGDGALTAGMSFEALNNVASVGGRLLVILNRNGMSISPTAGALGSWSSDHFREFFTRFGLRWLGTVDGHDLEALVGALRKARAHREPVVLEVLTVKGKGLEQAEKDPVAYHGVEGHSGRRRGKSYTQAFSEALIRAAERDRRIVAITAAMPTGTGLDAFARRFPDRFFDVGISEQHAVTLAAGMAAEGLRPVVAIYSTFLQRAYDQVIHDVALQRLPVVFAVDRAGIVGQDGPTHHGMFDLSSLLPVPGVVIAAPSDAVDLQRMLVHALARVDGPSFIRYPRDEIPLEPLRDSAPLRARLLRGGTAGVVVTYGSMVSRVLERTAGMDVAVWDARYLKPVDPEMVAALSSWPRVFVVEELHRPELALELALAFDAMGADTRVVPVHITPNQFVPHGTIHELVEEFIDWDALVEGLGTITDSSRPR